MEVVASLSQGRTASAQCGLFTHKSVPVIFEPPCSLNFFKAYWLRNVPTGLIFNNCTFCPHCIYVFCIYLRKYSDLCHLHHKLIGFYNRVGKCLLRGTNWVFQ